MSNPTQTPWIADEFGQSGGTHYQYIYDATGRIRVATAYGKTLEEAQANAALIVKGSKAD